MPQIALPGHMGGDRTYDTGELTDALPGDSAFSVGNCIDMRSIASEQTTVTSRRGLHSNV